MRRYEGKMSEKDEEEEEEEEGELEKEETIGCSQCGSVSEDDYGK